MRVLFAALAFLGFACSLIVHVSSIFGIDISRKIPFVWLLHIGIFFTFIPMLIAARVDQSSNSKVVNYKKLFPLWILVFGYFIWLYVIFNFLYFIYSTQGGSPAIQDGNFVLKDHGRIIKEISKEQYDAFLVNEVRGFSGHWLIFYFFPFAYFTFRKNSNIAFKPDPH